MFEILESAKGKTVEFVHWGSGKVPMIKTFDFLLKAQKNPGFSDKLRFAIRSGEPSMVCTETHRLSFDAATQKVLVEACANENACPAKTIPMQMSFRALTRMLDGVWDGFVEGDISRVETE